MLDLGAESKYRNRGDFISVNDRAADIDKM